MQLRSDRRRLRSLGFVARYTGLATRPPLECGEEEMCRRYGPKVRTTRCTCVNEESGVGDVRVLKRRCMSDTSRQQERGSSRLTALRKH
jgi:hypothetical protein